jgi:CheY-like chemotaxis protein/two-component sensor histidine kinase
MMERQVDTMVRLVDDLLEVSRVTRGMIELREEQVDLGRALRQAIETSQPLIESARHQLVVEIPDEPMPVRGDVVRLAQVFSNLLNNAARYTPKGGRIVVSVAAVDGHAVVRVQDSGIGLSAEMLPKVFDLFMQVRNTPQTVREGLGIGLTLVKNLTELHRGFVRVHSEGLGQGSTFSVHLPLSLQQDTSLLPANLSIAASLQGCRVVIVDDNRDAADSLGMVLQTLGVVYQVAYSGAAGLARITEDRPHCAIIDIGMPGMDGYEVGRTLRDDPQMRDVTLIALTGWGQDVDRQRTRLAGFAHHLVKPVNLEALRSILDSVRPRVADGRLA